MDSTLASRALFFSSPFSIEFRSTHITTPIKSLNIENNFSKIDFTTDFNFLS